MACFMIKLNNEKLAEAEKSAQLQAQVNSLNEKISNISKTINSNNVNSNIESKLINFDKKKMY